MHICSVYVDESGDLGSGKGSSKYITIGALVTTQPERVERIPLRIRKRRLKKSLQRKPELKFHNSNPEIRKGMLKLVMALEDVAIASIIVNKAGMPPGLKQSPERFYDFICCQLLVEIMKSRGERCSLRAVFDARPHNRPPSYDFGGRIGAMIEKELSRTGLPPVRMEISVIDSRNSGGLQTADFVVGSIQRKYERNDPSYYRTIAPAIIIEKRLF